MLLFILVTLRKYVDIFIDMVFSFVWEKQKQSLPDLDARHNILLESAVSLAAKIRNKELKSEDLVKACIERIEIVNPIINAVAEDRFEAALAEAREVDKLIAAGLSDKEARKKPFLGVPYTTKESQPIKGMKMTLGLWSRREAIAEEDSEAVVRLRAAGAIPIASSNLPEMLIWQETRNPVYGMTVNPHHGGRSVGGSSGAEAALTAFKSLLLACVSIPHHQARNPQPGVRDDGEPAPRRPLGGRLQRRRGRAHCLQASAISLCSDLGGSTRMPAFYCGMFGHHPTPGTINIKGVVFRKGGEESMASLGFITKHAEDIAPLTQVLAGDRAPELKLDRDIDIEDIQFYYLEKSDDWHVSSIRPDLRNAMRRVLAKINRAVPTANSPQPYYHEGFNHMYSLWNYWMTKEPENYAKLLANGKGEASGIKELFKKLFCLSHHCFYSILRLLELQVLPSPNAEWAEKLSEDFKRDLFSKLGDTGVLLLPSAPHVAPYHYSCLLRPYNFAYWAVVNALKCPATQIPLGPNSSGLPLGIQVLAAPHNDALCIAVAKYLEKEFGGAVFPCKVQQ